ncbi:hypothetical protein AK812_SmicGene5754 [Symbiodinium microadriaticum]|uniref:Uncharacterized protein n=1 Tax=Symbiodinium microadriaticum TaxID=2951 RepID=A0A1Q9ET09_SYMMI|nr:hypothetical protein AK812_SmicGene5754 [Symbiodinium microadriaticum]CAE7200174.1 unnamed protein product [Symbiodinium microadriaticum]CAE7944817.1 unnamed protein product [Symbiodinium sp. KB8]
MSELALFHRGRRQLPPARGEPRLRLLIVLALVSVAGSRCWLSGGTLRRAALLSVAQLGLPPAEAFENRVAEYKGPKTPGSQPSGVGTGTLSGCGGAPNCFSSAPGTDEDHFLEPWLYASGGMAGAVADLQKALKDYPPGQQEIDGGGFEIKKMDLEKGYIYVQFESLKRGYIDDVEFLVKPTDKESGQVLVRSASRLGYLDLGVNAKRLNRLSQALRDVPGGRWTAPKISQALFPRYVSENR